MNRIRCALSDLAPRSKGLIRALTAMSLGNDKLVIDKFSFRQFDDPAYAGTKIPIPKSEFMNTVLQYYEEKLGVEKEFKDHPVLVDGYAPFCKHIFMPNFCDGILQGEVQITDDNRHLLQTKYEARKENELPVLTRFFPKNKVTAPKAKYLDLIRKTFLALFWVECFSGVMRSV